METNNLALFILLGLWVTALIIGSWALEHEEFTPVALTKAPSDFPARSALRLASGRPTLIVFAHPRCPCTRATLSDLGTIMAERPLHTILVFTLPPGVPEGWEAGELLNTARKMPKLQIVLDRGGAEAKRFGVIGSGHALLFSSRGKLLFSGGITPSRGHAGENPGATAIMALSSGQPSTITHTPVFGCALL